MPQDTEPSEAANLSGPLATRPNAATFIDDHADYRDDIDDIRRLNGRNAQGEMVFLGSVIKIEKSYGPQLIRRFNLYPAANVTSSAAPRKSSSQTLEFMQQLASDRFPSSIGFDWTGVSYQERKISGGEF